MNTTGTSLVSSGFPLLPGQLSDADLTAKKIALWIGGVEKAVYVEALRGRYPDGSVRSVLIQCSHNIPDTTNPVAAEIRLGTARATTDLTKTAVTESVYLAARVIVPTDIAHLCACEVTFQDILPAASETATDAAWFDAFYLDRFARVDNSALTDASDQSTYEVSRALLGRWQATGTFTYYARAWSRARGLLNDTVPTNGAAEYSPSINADGITANVGNDPKPSEQHSQRWLSYASAYLLSGWEIFWTQLCVAAQWGAANVPNRATAIGSNANGPWVSSQYMQRYNIKAAWGLLLASMVDCTGKYNNANGYGTARTLDVPNECDWILDAYETWPYTTGSDRRNGMVGMREVCTDAVDAGVESAATGDFPNFQAAVHNTFLWFYYRNVQADSRIIPWIKKSTDVVLAGVQTLQSGEPGFGSATYGIPYLAKATAGRYAPGTHDGNGQSHPWTLPMFATSCAVLAKAYPSDVVNGKTYAQWYAVMVDDTNMLPDNDAGDHGTGNLRWNLTGGGVKLFAEAFAFCMDAPAIMANGVTTGPASVRTPTQHAVP